MNACKSRATRFGDECLGACDNELGESEGTLYRKRRIGIERIDRFFVVAFDEHPEGISILRKCIEVKEREH